MDNSFFKNIKGQFTYTNIVSFFFSLFELSYLYVLIRESSYKLILMIFIVPIFMFNKAYIEYYKKNKISFDKKYKQIVFILVIFILSLLLTASINVNLFIMNKGAMSVPANVGMILLTYQFIVYIIISLCKVNFTSNTKTKGYMFLLYAQPSLLITGFLFLVYYPGNCSADTIVIWNDVQSNIYADAHPIVYMLLIKGLSLLWNNIAVISLCNVAITTLTFGYVCYQLDKMGVNRIICGVISIVLPLFPANALYSVTAWKDIPYTMGLIVLSIMILKCVITDYYDKKGSFPALFAVSMFTLFVRHNAIISVLMALFFMGVYYIAKLDGKKIVKTLILGIALVVAFFGIKQIIFSVLASSPFDTVDKAAESAYADRDIKLEDIDNTKKEALQATSMLSIQFPTVIALQQIIYTEHFAGDEFTNAEKEFFARVVIEEGLEEHKEKYADNDIWMFYYKPNKIDSYHYPAEEFWDYYYSMYKKYPSLMFEGYKKITSIVWCSSPYGSVAYRADSKTSVEDAVGREFEPIITHGIRYKLDNTVFRYADSSFAGVFWRPALFFMLSLVLLVIANKKHGVGTILFFLPTFFNQITYMLVTASQDTRYTYINYTIFMIVLALAVTAKVRSSSDVNKR